MKITLVNSDFPSETAVPPLGLVSLAQAVEARGHKASLRDYQLAQAKDSRDPMTFAAFCDTSDDVLGVSVSGFALPLVILGLKELKKSRPDILIILGGIGASGAARQIMEEFTWIDLIVNGEGEYTLCELLDCLQAGQVPDGVPGLVYRRGAKVLFNKERPRAKDLESFGKLEFHHIDLTNYQMINVISSRGCPYPCTFCDVAPYWRRNYTARPLEYVVQEIEAIYQKVSPPPVFVFVDDTLTVNQTRVKKLCKMLETTGLNIEWACYARANDLDESLLKIMAKSGCRKIYLGLESGSDKILSRIRKGFDAETGHKAALLASKYIPIVQTTFVWGFPFESWEEFYETLMVMAHLTAKGVCVKANILTPLPFSLLFQEYAESMIFLPEYSPQLHLADFHLDSEAVNLIRKYPRIFPCFYLYESPTITAKYDLMREMKLSPEHIWDLWVMAKGPVPTRAQAR